MLRRIRTIFCGLSLLLFLTLFVAWLMGREHPIGIWYKSTQINLYREFISSSHYSFLTIDHNQIKIGHWSDPYLLWQIKQSLLLEEGSPTAQRDVMTMLQIARGIPPIHKNFAAPTQFFLPDGLYTGPNPRDPWPPNPRTHSFLAISFEHESSGQIIVDRLSLPIWMPLLLLATPPLLRLRTFLKTYRRRRSQLCPSCGYDIRATPDRCPECGHAAAIASN